MKKLAFIFCLFFLGNHFAFADNYYCSKQIVCKRKGQERNCRNASEGISINEGDIGWGGDIYDGTYKLVKVMSYKVLASCVYEPAFPSHFSVINLALRRQYQANQEGLTKWQPMKGSKEFLNCENLPELEPQDCPLKHT